MNSPMVTDILQVGKELQVAYQKRSIDSKKSSVVVFIHGFVSSKDFFRFAFTDHSLLEYTLIRYITKPNENLYSI